jgi:hypothetical protein
MSNHVIHVKSCHSCHIMSFMSNHDIHVKSCHSCQIMTFMSNHFIHVKSCHSCHIMSFMSNHVIHVKSCHLCQIMSFMSWVIGLSRKFTKVGRGEGGGVKYVFLGLGQKGVIQCFHEFKVQCSIPKSPPKQQFFDDFDYRLLQN